jgi:hypothetical protein
VLICKWPGRHVIVFVLLFLCVPAVLDAQTAPLCTTAEQCRILTREALAAREYERAHDLAWLAYQKTPRQDAATMALLARAQSLSGRADDAFVMLRRLADAGVVVEDVEHSDDFRNVRSHRQWPQLLGVYAAINSNRPPAAAVPAPSLFPPPAAGAPTPPATPTSSPPAAAPRVRSVAPPPSPNVNAPAASADASVVTKAATAVEMKRAGDDLALPDSERVPTAIAYDAVSARFVLANGVSDALTVLSQTSSNATAFTSRGWSQRERTTAVAIDPSAGDLWVAVHGSSGSALHRMQLISGRRLDVIELAADEDAEFVSLAVSRDAVYALDATTRRIYRRARTQSKVLERWASLPKDLTPTSLAYSANALFVAHTGGLLRIDLATRRARPVAANNTAPVPALYSLAWNEGTLLGIGRSGEQWTLTRVRLNAAGTAVAAVETLGPAASHAATTARGVYYYIAVADDGDGVVVRGVAPR